MADNEGEDASLRGNEWEVVQLTASAYAAAPSPKAGNKKDDGMVTIQSNFEAETSQPLFMSDHFLFPPNQHENLPLVLDDSPMLKKAGLANIYTECSPEGFGNNDHKIGDSGMFNKLVEEIPVIPLFDSKGNMLPLSVYEESRKFTPTHPKEIGNTTCEKACSFKTEPEMVGSIIVADDVLTARETDSENPTYLPKPTAEEEHSISKIPGDVWWKRATAALYEQAKETNTLWSLLIAAAFMGLVVLGQRWQHERAKVEQHNLQLNFKNERNGKLWAMHRLKDIIVGGHRRGSFLGGGISDER